MSVLIYKEYINTENQTLKSHFVAVLGDFFFVPLSTKPVKKSNLNFSALGTYYLPHHLKKRILVPKVHFSMAIAKKSMVAKVTVSYEKRLRV